MGTTAYQTLDRKQRRRLVLTVLGRAFGLSLALLVGYGLLPVSSDGTTGGLVALGLGLVAIVVVLVHQLRRIVDAAHPRLQAIVAVATVVPLFIVEFAYVYVWLSKSDPSNFTEPIGRLDGLYFVITVLTTTGFGDITAVSSAARVVVTIQMLLDLALIGVVAKLIVGAARLGVQRRKVESTQSPANER